MIYKANNLKLKDLDTKKGIVAFYFAAFGNEDSHSEISEPGCFLDSIKESRDRLKHFYNHDEQRTPGVLKEIGEDKVGGFAVSQLMKTTLGKDTMIEYEEGAITEHSFGHNEKYIKKEGKSVFKYDLWEVSSLTHWGSNSLTPTISVKSLNDIDLLLKSLTKILTTTSISDERAVVLQKEFDQLNILFKSLTKKEEPKGLDWSYLANNINF